MRWATCGIAIQTCAALPMAISFSRTSGDIVKSASLHSDSRDASRFGGGRQPHWRSEFIDCGFQARLVCVDTTQLDAAFAGRTFDPTLLDELPPSVDPCGERGEFHTFVSAGPGFAKQVEYEVGEIVLRDGRFAFCDLVER